MSVRIIIVLLALPLFLLLVGVNSLLLYQQEVDDIEQGLRGQALAAAVTVAEFAREARDPLAELGEPRRLAALRSAGAKIPGLDTLYLAAPDGRILNLLDRPAIVRYSLKAPDHPVIIGNWHDNERDPLIAARAPAGRGYVAVADIDARPLNRRAFHLKRLSIVLVAGSAVLAILLGLVVAARVTREFRRTRSIIEARGGGADPTALGIREVRDLADAIGLIDKSVSDDLDRLGRGGSPDPMLGIRALRERHFPDLSARSGAAILSIRSLPRAKPGAFHVALPCDGGWRVALGEVGGEPAAALASAVALRDHLLDGPAEHLGQRLAFAAEAFGAERLVERFVGPERVALALRDDAGAVAAYAAHHPDLDPEALTADLAILYPDAGIIVATGPA
ncbi:hypothetical protein [Rhizorhabdus dicambivorans]|uniref:Uncharacterized protein n=1 Tax=Rhizorhabdus dicambivorans TaxID=1850238 RepID=A0A2A4FRK5_9SPHN|nr:hypothetical protein [Rhizorhabdus dicambivorans]ATE66465.1 hypothetical protein CMV14_20340 [Rhizorhabdus dicambivorans]PCE41043.1 hypothetical protein COO09_16980 [Rhizorhabdus dicambivorans]